jgi:hypothetical protein
MSPFAFELVRQLLRWLTIYLIGVGLPPDTVDFLGNPETVNFVGAILSLALAETGWVASKLRRQRN